MKKLIIHIPEIHQREVMYSFDRLFSIMGLDQSPQYFASSDLHDFIIEFEEKQVTITNSFFNTNDQLFRAENIPLDSAKVNVEINEESFTIQSIYGGKNVDVGAKDIHIETDIIAGTFFMLTRWEEYVLKAKDNLGRFDYRLALSVKSAFYKRPVVDEYASLLKAALNYIGYTFPAHKQVSTSIITFDIDQLQKWQRPKILLESVYKNIMKLRFASAIHDTWSFMTSKIGRNADPYLNIELVLDDLKRSKIEKALFYFKTTFSNAKQDRNRYDLRAEKVKAYFRQTKELGYEIGLHPGFDAYNNEELMGKELNELSESCGQQIVHVRQHYLRFEVPTTWSIQEKLKLKYDSSMAYSHAAGFRVGTSFPFQVFDFLNRETIDLVECPLLFMETPYMETPNQLLRDLAEIKGQVDKFSGSMIVLWHNGNLEYRWQRKLFKKMLDHINQN